jgi:hypothetical protein
MRSRRCGSGGARSRLVGDLLDPGGRRARNAFVKEHARSVTITDLDREGRRCSGSAGQARVKNHGDPRQIQCQKSHIASERDDGILCTRVRAALAALDAPRQNDSPSSLQTAHMSSPAESRVAECVELCMSRTMVPSVESRCSRGPASGDRSLCQVQLSFLPERPHDSRAAA